MLFRKKDKSNPQHCDKGISCDECSERFSCWTEKVPHYGLELAALKEEIEAIEIELNRLVLEPRRRALEERKEHIIKNIEKIETIISLGTLDQDKPPSGWTFGVLSTDVTSTTVDKALHKQVDKRHFIASVPERVVKIYRSFHAKANGDIVVFSNNKNTFKRWDAMPFKARLLLYEDKRWYFLAEWDDKER